MALMPGAIQRPLGRNPGPLTADILCLHTIVGGLKGTDGYFRSVAVFSHFGVGGRWSSDIAAKLDGVIYQWQDTAFRAAANLDGNPYIISVETADNAARPIAPWTPAQERAIIAIMVWAYRTHGIPLVLLPDSRRGRRGIAYHQLGCDPYRAAGGDKWSSAYGKDCPTDARIARIPALIAQAKAIVAPPRPAPPVLQPRPAPPKEEDDMPYTETQLRQFMAEEVERVGLRLMQTALTGAGNTIVSPAEAAGFATTNVRAQVGAAVSLLMYGDDRDDTKDKGTHPDNIQRVRAEVAGLAAGLMKLGQQVAEGISEVELAAALKRALTDLPDVDLTTEAITRVAQSTATLLQPTAPSPESPTGV